MATLISTIFFTTAAYPSNSPILFLSILFIFSSFLQFILLLDNNTHSMLDDILTFSGNILARKNSNIAQRLFLALSFSFFNTRTLPCSHGEHLSHVPVVYAHGAQQQKAANGSVHINICSMSQCLAPGNLHVRFAQQFTKNEFFSSQVVIYICILIDAGRR